MKVHGYYRETVEGRRSCSPGQEEKKNLKENQIRKQKQYIRGEQCRKLKNISVLPAELRYIMT